MRSKSQQFVFHTPNLTITTVANFVRSISNFQLSPRQLELCGGGSKIVQWTILARANCLEVRGTLFLPFVKSIKVFDEKYFEFNSQNKEIVF
ncbi:hypothetical protein RFL36_11140, partial [Streptococcus suis]|uniref:hypothetical protein n=1 Tax=Streptococcus suis TaxID=1307 RepID=UPI002FC5830B